MPTSTRSRSSSSSVISATRSRLHMKRSPCVVVFIVPQFLTCKFWVDRTLAVEYKSPTVTLTVVVAESESESGVPPMISISTWTQEQIERGGAAAPKQSAQPFIAIHILKFYDCSLDSPKSQVITLDFTLLNGLDFGGLYVVSSCEFHYETQPFL